jgi:hypothetical protein
VGKQSTASVFSFIIFLTNLMIMDLRMALEPALDRRYMR